MSIYRLKILEHSTIKRLHSVDALTISLCLSSEMAQDMEIVFHQHVTPLDQCDLITLMLG